MKIMTETLIPNEAELILFPANFRRADFVSRLVPKKKGNTRKKNEGLKCVLQTSERNVVEFIFAKCCEERENLFSSRRVFLTTFLRVNRNLSN